MKNISLISLSILLSCSMICFSCQKEKFSTPISNTNESVNPAAMAGESQAEIIGHMCSNNLLTLENTPFLDLDIYYAIEENSALDYDQKYNALLSNSNALACLISRKDKEDIVSNNLLFLNDPMNLNAVTDILLDDLGPFPIQDNTCLDVYKSASGVCLKTWTFCEGAGCNKDYMDCNAGAKSNYLVCVGTTGGVVEPGVFMLPNITIYFQ